MQSLRINNVKPVQEDFWGNGAIYHGYAGMPDDAGRVYTEEQCIIEAERAAKMKLKIARTMYKWWAWDEKTNTWDWDNEIMTIFYKWLQRMKDGGITVALNTGWCSPGDINSTHWNGKSPFTVEGDWEQSKKNYGDWVSETVKQLIIKRGFTNIKIFVMFTEPQYGSGTLPDGKNTYDCWFEAVQAAHNALVRDGLRDKIKLMGPNEGSTVTSEMLHWAAEHANEYLDIYSSHTYQFAAPTPKKFLTPGKNAISMSIAGARFCQTVPLKPNTDYVASANLVIQINEEIPENPGSIHFGAYIDDGRNDIHTSSGSGPSIPVVNGSAIDIDPTTISGDKYTKVTVKFNSGDANSCVIGVFHDVKCASLSYCNLVELKEEGTDTNILINGDFSDKFNGWKTLFADGTTDAYYDWYTWAKTGLQYVPEGKPYCFDEYNVTFNRDNSHPYHGAEICNAAVALMNSGCRTSLLWTIFDQQWPNNHTYNNDSFVDGDHRCGVMPVLTRSLVPHLSYYAFTLLSRYIDGEGTKIYEGFGKDSLHTTMAVSPNGEITVTVVNCKEEADEFTITFDKDLDGATLNRHYFDPATCRPDEKAEIIGTDKVFENITDTLSDKIPAYGVIVYTTMKD